MKYKFYYLSLIFVILLSTCANKYRLEENSKLQFSESYYQDWVAGIKQGGAGFSIFLELKPTVDLDKDQIKVEGIYFKNRYANIEYFPPTKMKAFIRTLKSTASGGSGKLGDDNFNKEPEKTEEVSVPFPLEDNEAIVTYKERGVLKYIKISLEKKVLLNPPM